MNFEQYITETLNEAKKPVETINESEALVVLGGLAAALFAVGMPLATYAYVGHMDGSLKKSFNEIVKNFRYKSLNKKATALINSDEEVQQAFKAYTKAPKGQKLKSLKSFMELLGTKLDTEHRGLLQKVIGDLKAEYKTQSFYNEGIAAAIENVGGKECWSTHKAKGTKMKNGKEVPNCKPKNESIETVGKPKFDVDTYVVYDIGEDKYEVRISKIKDGDYILSDILKNGEEKKGTLSKPVEWVDTNAKVLK